MKCVLVCLCDEMCTDMCALLRYVLLRPAVLRNVRVLLSVFIKENITLRANHSGAVYCNWSCLWRAGGVCYHDNSKLCASIFTKLGL